MRAKIRHIALAVNDPESAAAFFRDGLGLQQVGTIDNELATGVFLSDGTVNLAVLKFHTDQLGKGDDFTGVHHFGVLVEDEAATREKLTGLGARLLMDVPDDPSGNFFEVKLVGPDGIIFDISASPWAGAEALDS